MNVQRRTLAASFLGALVFFIAVSMLRIIWDPGGDLEVQGLEVWKALTRLSLSVAIVVGFISLVWYLIDFQASFERHIDRPKTSGAAFPYAGTSFVAVALLILLGIYLSAYLFVMAPPDMDSSDYGFLLTVLANSEFKQPLIAFLAAGIGSSIATIYAYLRHASTLQDFDPSFIPWYFLRPLLGSLLGLVFYWLIIGGIIAILPVEESGAPVDLDLNGLAGVSALVGLFSRQAIEKLREIFHVLFVTQGSIPSSVRRKAESDLLDRLPDDLRSRINLHLESNQDRKTVPDTQHSGTERSGGS